MSDTNIKDFFIELSEKKGIDRIGFAKAVTLDNEYNRFLDWIDSGLHADMHYLARRQGKRRDVNALLNNTKTVIVTIHNYNTGFSHKVDSASGKLSRYAWGDDYHDILKEKLLYITREAEKKFPANKFKVYVDTGPILEKQWALVAGLGWQGKNSLVLNRELGSFFFIGIILTDLTVQPDDRIKSYCGTCTACIDSCPTNAIVEPYVVDSNKCISYWTIETKGKTEFPESVGRNLSGWIFGCDICQDVCPWNKSKNLIDDICFKPRNEQTSIELNRILEMDEESFRLRFRNTTIKRSKVIGLQRNARELLKNE